MSTNSPKHHERPPRPPLGDVARSMLGGCLGIGLIGVVLQQGFNDHDMILMAGSFGASAVLVYGVPSSPLAQPLAVIFGHVLSALVGVTIFMIMGEANWIAAGLAVALAIGVMQLTRTVHPPGGATALIAVVGSPDIHALGYSYVLNPILFGVVVLVSVALVTNNLMSQRKWPVFWI